MRQGASHPIDHRPEELSGNRFRVTGFHGVGLPTGQVPIDEFWPGELDGVLHLSRGGQLHRHCYWLRYLRRGPAPARRKLVAVELMIRFGTFDYLPQASQDRYSPRSAALLGLGLWGIADLGIALRGTGAGSRNPFNKFNDDGELVFEPSVVLDADGVPAIRVDYRLRHLANETLGAAHAPGCQETGALLVRSTGLVTLEPSSGSADGVSWQLVPISGEVHQRPIATEPAPPERTLTVCTATDVAIPRIAADPPVLVDQVQGGAVEVRGFAGLDSPERIEVWHTGHPSTRVAVRGDDTYDGGLLIEYVRREAPGVGFPARVRVGLALRFRTSSYLVRLNEFADSIVFHGGRRYPAYRDVSLRALTTDPVPPPAGAERPAPVDRAVPAGGPVPRSRLWFTAEAHDGAEGEAPGIRIRWVEEPAGEAPDAAAPIEGSFLLSTDESAAPMLVFEDENSHRYLTVTS